MGMALVIYHIALIHVCFEEAHIKFPMLRGSADLRANGRTGKYGYPGWREQCSLLFLGIPHFTISLAAICLNNT